MKIKIFTIFILAAALIIVTTACGQASAPAGTTQTTASQTTEAAQQPGESQQMKVFTPEELSKYDGKNGNPVYVAVEGKVYDVSDVPEWKDGIHQNRFEAGKDLTQELKLSPHGKSKLELVPMVGILEK